ncbi:hypothetical protein [uncultured Helicobacter sp.]|uniref:hypothetical protein n=1 Tax=uncultured Helicobacter sp. TaxID=175537 RepID=UPI0025DB24EE|nr:hypothetical protein [uncultured Helicobacter sp.]
MGFGDFAMGYLVGQSFSGPNHIPDGNAPYSEWSSQAKKDWDKKCDEAYWRAWDKACKKKVIERLRNPNDEFRIGSITYPDISKEIWADDSREEAQREGYKHEFETFVKKVLERGDYRVID